MDNSKYERISNFVSGWGYKPDEINAYIRKVAPNMQYNAQRAKRDGINAFFAAVLGKEQPPATETPIPSVPEHETGLSRDLWLMLGTGPDKLTLEDVADYYAEYVTRTQVRREAEAPSSMNFSRAIHAMGEEDRQRQNCADIIERHKQITERKDDFSMDSFLQNLNTEADSTPRTITASNSINIRADGRANDSLNDFFRSLL